MPNSLEALPEESESTDAPKHALEQEPVDGVSVLSAYAQSFSGPLPPPEILHGYAQLYSDAPRIIFQAFEEQGSHRRAMESSYLRTSEKRANRGQILGTLIVAAAMLGGMTLVYFGHEITGGTIVAAALAGGIMSYVFGDGPSGRREKK